MAAKVALRNPKERLSDHETMTGPRNGLCRRTADGPNQVIRTTFSPTAEVGSIPIDRSDSKMSYGRFLSFHNSLLFPNFRNTVLSWTDTVKNRYYLPAAVRNQNRTSSRGGPPVDGDVVNSVGACIGLWPAYAQNFMTFAPRSNEQ